MPQQQSKYSTLKCLEIEEYDKAGKQLRTMALPWESGSKWSFDEDKWEFYNVEEDFSECHDLAEKNPTKLQAVS